MGASKAAVLLVSDAVGPFSDGSAGSFAALDFAVGSLATAVTSETVAADSSGLSDCSSNDSDSSVVADSSNSSDAWNDPAVDSLDDSDVADSSESYCSVSLALAAIASAAVVFR